MWEDILAPIVGQLPRGLSKAQTMMSKIVVFVGEALIEYIDYARGNAKQARSGTRFSPQDSTARRHDVVCAASPRTQPAFKHPKIRYRTQNGAYTTGTLSMTPPFPLPFNAELPHFIPSDAYRDCLRYGVPPIRQVKAKGSHEGEEHLHIFLCLYEAPPRIDCGWVKARALD